jgi:hypothetical protein
MYTVAPSVWVRVATMNFEGGQPLSGCSPFTIIYVLLHGVSFVVGYMIGTVEISMSPSLNNLGRFKSISILNSLGQFMSISINLVS